MQPIDIACRYCCAQKGEHCYIMSSGERVYAVPVAIGFHHERIEDAGMCTTNADPVDLGSFDKAVEASGLV